MFGDTTNLKIDETAKWSGYIFLYNIRKLFIYVGVGKIKLIAISQLVLFCCHNDKPALDKCRVNVKEPQRRIIRFAFFLYFTYATNKKRFEAEKLLVRRDCVMKFDLSKLDFFQDAFSCVKDFCRGRLIFESDIEAWVTRVCLELSLTHFLFSLHIDIEMELKMFTLYGEFLSFICLVYQAGNVIVPVSDCKQRSQQSIDTNRKWKQTRNPISKSG